MLAVLASGLVCAVPLAHVIETMRPLPVERLADVPSCVLGVSRVRAVATPVIDLRALLGGAAVGESTRFVTLRAGERQVALAVDRVLGVRELATAALEQLPALLSGTNSELIEAVGELDQQLLLVLRAACLCPESAWLALAAVPA